MIESAQPRALSCARCGAAFGCGADTGTCWCFEEEFRLPMPAGGKAADCLCPSCLREQAKAMSTAALR